MPLLYIDMKEVEVTEVTQNGTVHDIEPNTTFQVVQEWYSRLGKTRMSIVDDDSTLYTVEIRYGKLCFAPDRANINTFAEFVEG